STGICLIRTDSGNALIHSSGCEVSPTASGRIASWTTATETAAISAERRRSASTSHRPSGATRNPAKKCVSTAPALHTAHQARLRCEGSRSERAKNQNDRPHRTVNNMYDLASWEYQIMNGLSAANAAATTPAA